MLLSIQYSTSDLGLPLFSFIPFHIVIDIDERG